MKRHLNKKHLKIVSYWIYGIISCTITGIILVSSIPWLNQEGVIWVAPAVGFIALGTILLVGVAALCLYDYIFPEER